jgi:hypothetical protein
VKLTDDEFSSRMTATSEIPTGMKLNFTDEWLPPIQQTAIKLPQMNLGQHLAISWTKPDCEWARFHLKVIYDKVPGYDLTQLTWKLTIEDSLPLGDHSSISPSTSTFDARMLQVTCTDKEHTWNRCNLSWRNCSYSKFLATKTCYVSDDTRNVTISIYYDV